MSGIFRFEPGTSPLIVSVPHDGWQIPNDIAMHMSDAGRGIPDTDWHVAKLYDFARGLGASMLVAKVSRYVVDLNRPPDDAGLYADRPATGLVPTRTFSGKPIYTEDVVIDVAARVAQYWQPYHAKLQAVIDSVKDRHGIALLWDAHSIASRVPALFEGELPVLNFGTNDGASCGPALISAVRDVAREGPFDAVVDARFRGGYITRHYGCPAAGVHAVQLELAQRAYMNERTLEYDREKAAHLQSTLEALLLAYVSAALAL